MLFSSIRNAPQDPAPVSTGERYAVRLSCPLPRWTKTRAHRLPGLDNQAQCHPRAWCMQTNPSCRRVRIWSALPPASRRRTALRWRTPPAAPSASAPIKLGASAHTQGARDGAGTPGLGAERLCRALNAWPPARSFGTTDRLRAALGPTSPWVLPWIWIRSWIGIWPGIWPGIWGHVPVPRPVPYCCHRHPAPQRRDHDRRGRLRPAGRHRHPTAVPARRRRLRTPLARPSPPTGHSINGAGSSPSTPPPSASWTGSCTTPPSSSPPASPTACATPGTTQEAAPPHPETRERGGLSPGQNRGPQTGH